MSLIKFLEHFFSGIVLYKLGNIEFSAGEQLIKEHFYQIAGGCFTVWYRTLIYSTTQPDIMPPPDESTSLLPEARPSVNWRQKGGRCCYWFCCCGYFLLLLLLLALVALSLIGVVMTIKVFLNVTEDVLPTTSPHTTNSIATEGNTTGENLDLKLETQFQFALILSSIRNGIDTLVCWIFLVIVTRSPQFVGCSTITKNLFRLAKFWTLVCLLVLYILGGVLRIWFFRSRRRALYYRDTTDKIKVEVVMEIVNVFTKVALVGVLNHVQLRNVARSGFKYWLLKGTLIVTWIFQFCTLINTIMTVSFIFNLPVVTDNSYVRQVGSFTNAVMELLFLSIVIKIGALIWTKIWHDDKCIIGNIER